MDSVQKVRMNDDAELYQNTNKVTRRDAIKCLQEYATNLKWKKYGERIIDIGCAEGSVTSILIENIPSNYAKLIACDINEKFVKYASEHYENERTKFIILDIESDLPNDLRGAFDHVFSFYALHWIRDQVKAFTNIYNLLSDSGECFLTLLGRSSIYSIFWKLTRSPKWTAWLSDYDKFVSPYHNCQDPDEVMSKMLQKIGFQYINVRIKQKLHVHESLEAMKRAVASVSPFKIPDYIYEDFMDDFVLIARDMGKVDDVNDTATFNYNLIIIHCRK